MEPWRIHRLIEKDEKGGHKTQIGGAIVKMNIAASIGSLDEISARPVSVEQMNEESWDG